MTTAQEVLNQKRNQYEPAFYLLVQDFLRVCEFIEPVDAHLQVFSHRLYELLLRASTEFESLSREILEAHGLDPAGNMNVHFGALKPPRCHRLSVGQCNPKLTSREVVYELE